MANGWERDKQWSDRFIPEIKGILGQYLIGEAKEEDQERNTDLIVLKMEVVRIACRIRQFKYLERYGNEFTVRSKRPGGTKTELTKIIEGWGDYLFYGFSDELEKNLFKWTLIDLKRFRLWFNREIIRTKNIPGIEQKNIDQSSNFIAFKISNEFIFAKQEREFEFS